MFANGHGLGRRRQPVHDETACQPPSWWGLIDSRCKRGGGGLPMMRWPAGALRRYPAARGDENIDDMVTRGRFECRER
jgi:hypothetical protein